MIENVRYDNTLGLVSFRAGKWTAYYNDGWEAFTHIDEDRWEYEVENLTEHYIFHILPECYMGRPYKYTFKTENEVKAKFSDLPFEEIEKAGQSLLILKSDDGEIYTVLNNYDPYKNEYIWHIIKQNYDPASDMTPRRKDGQSISEYLEENKDSQSIFVEMLDDFCNHEIRDSMSSLLIVVDEAKAVGFEYDDIIKVRPDLNGFGISRETYESLPHQMDLCHA